MERLFISVSPVLHRCPAFKKKLRNIQKYQRKKIPLSRNNVTNRTRFIDNPNVKLKALVEKVSDTQEEIGNFIRERKVVRVKEEW